MKWLYRIGHLFAVRSPRSEDESFLKRLIEQDAASLRGVDPETGMQWLRLQRTLSRMPGTRVRWIPRVAFAGAVAAVVLAVAYLFVNPPTDADETFATGKGEQVRVVLPDSTEVMLNYATELVVQKFRPGHARRLALNGEAYFHVRRNSIPFIVATDVAEVRVVGTEFNVRVRGGVAEVAVVHGAVAVSARDSTLSLAAHQMAVCSEGGVPYHAGVLPSPEYPGWMSGKLFLNRMSFAAACRELELRFDILIRLNDASLHDERISGVLDVRTPQSALTALCGLVGKKFGYDGETYTIY